MTNCFILEVEPLGGTRIEEAIQNAGALIQSLPCVSVVRFKFNDRTVSVFRDGHAMEWTETGMGRTFPAPEGA